MFIVIQLDASFYIDIFNHIARVVSKITKDHLFLSNIM